MSSSFVFDDELYQRSTIAVIGSSLSVLGGLVAAYVYFVHPARISLHNAFNNLIVWATVLQGLQGLQRITAGAFIMQQSMNDVRCNILGMTNTFLDVSAATLVIGFYYNLLTVRLPLFPYITRKIQFQTVQSIEKIIWFLLAAVFGFLMCVLCVTTMDEEANGSYFSYRFGWCQLRFRHDGQLTPVFTWGIAFVSVVEMTFAIASFLSMRCVVGDSEMLSWSRHWAIYCRWCGVIVFNFLCYGIAAIGLAHEDSGPQFVILEMCMWPFAGLVYALIFIATEQILPWRQGQFQGEGVTGPENGFSSAMSSLLATEVSGVRSTLISHHDASALESNADIFRSKSRQSNATAARNVIVHH